MKKISLTLIFSGLFLAAAAQAHPGHEAKSKKYWISTFKYGYTPINSKLQLMSQDPASLGFVSIYWTPGAIELSNSSK